MTIPFDKSASMKMIYKKREGIQQSPISVNVKVYYNSNKRNVKEEGKFYSVWRREKTPLGIFHKFAAQKGKGHYVGTIHQAQGGRGGGGAAARRRGRGLLQRWLVCFIGSLGQRKQPPSPWLPGLFTSDGQNRWIPFLLGRQNVL